VLHVAARRISVKFPKCLRLTDESAFCESQFWKEFRARESEDDLLSASRAIYRSSIVYEVITS
jgi:hypothetical protein